MPPIPSTSSLVLTRRECLRLAGAAGVALAIRNLQAAPEAFKLRYILSSALYGKMDLANILPEIRKAGAEHIDIWCLPHGNQREQIQEIGVEFFSEMLAKHNVKLGAFT